HYMSPEQIRDRQVDGRADVYSLGAVVYRLLTGEPPFQHQSPLGVLHLHLNEPPPKLSATRPELAPLDSVLRRALAKRPADRFPTVTAFADELTASVASLDDAGADRRDTPRVASPTERTVDLARIGTRQEFEVFEQRLRVRRAMGAVVATAILVGGTAALAATVSTDRPGARREHEPNDDLGSATHAEVAAEVTAEVKPAPQSLADVDTFEFLRPDADADVMTVELSGADSVDFVLRVVDRRGRVLVQSDGGGAGDGERVIGVRVPADGAYVSVRGALVEEVSAPPAYTLRARFRRAFDGEEVEPNDSAPQVLVGGRVVGAIGHSGDVDRFQIPGGDEGGRYAVRLSAVSDLDLAFQVGDLAGTRLPLRNELGVGGGESADLVVTADQFVGVPFVEVTAVGDTSAAVSHLTYTLTIERR
ncbi:MAG: hypothetical protein H6698_09045, partial [Myxococcales bacterium]|nr:hypothetical protein [Myxococcales bacterium]